MSGKHWFRLRVRTTIALWTGIGFIGGAVALLAVVSMAAAHGLLPWHSAFGSISVGREFLKFIAGIALGCVALWGIYAKATATTAGSVGS